MTTDRNTVAKWMSWLTWLIVLAMLTVFFDRILERQNNPNQNIVGLVTEQGVREVVLTRNPAGHYLTSGFINGKAVVFLLDTGASDVAIPGKLARRLELKKLAAVQYRTANGNVTGFLTKLDTVSIGNIRLHGIRGGINPTMKGNQVLLGMSFLKHLEFTQRGNQLILRQYPENH